MLVVFLTAAKHVYIILASLRGASACLLCYMEFQLLLFKCFEDIFCVFFVCLCGGVCLFLICQ